MRRQSVLWIVIATTSAAFFGCVRDPGGELAYTPCKTHVGSLNIETDAEATALEDVCFITGALTISGLEGRPTLALPNLQAVGGFFSVNETEVESVSLPTLTTLGGSLEVAGNASLTSFSAPALVTVEASVSFVANPALTAIDISSMEVAGELAIIEIRDPERLYAGGTLEVLAAPKLAYLGTLRIVETHRLERLEFPALRQVGGIIVARNLLLEEVVLDVDVSIGGDVILVENAALQALRLPRVELIIGDLIIAGSDESRGTPEPASAGALTSLELPALQSVGGVHITRNQALTELTLPALARAGCVRVAFNPSLRTFHMPLLESSADDCELVFPTFAAPGGFLVNDNDNLETVSMPLLASSREVRVERNPRLREIRYEALDDASIHISSNVALESLSFPALARASFMRIEDNPLSVSLSLPVLSETTGDVVIETTELALLSLPALTHLGEYFLLDGGGVLTLEAPALDQVEGVIQLVALDNVELDLSSLRRVWDSVNVLDCVRLTRLDVSSLRFSGGFYLSGNDNLTTCIGELFVEANVCDSGASD